MTFAIRVLDSVPVVPPELLAFLLRQNGRLFAGAWCSWSGPGGSAFGLVYKAPVSGLAPPLFKMICESMVREASEFDVRVRAALTR